MLFPLQSNYMLAHCYTLIITRVQISTHSDTVDTAEITMQALSIALTTAFQCLKDAFH